MVFRELIKISKLILGILYEIKKRRDFCLQMADIIVFSFGLPSLRKPSPKYFPILLIDVARLKLMFPNL